MSSQGIAFEQYCNIKFKISKLLSYVVTHAYKVHVAMPACQVPAQIDR